MDLPDKASTLSRVGDFAMTTVEAIEDRFGSDVLVGAVAIVADVHCASADDRGINPIIVACSDPRLWVQSALLAEASIQAEKENEKRADAVEDDHDARVDDDDDDE